MANGTLGDRWALGTPYRPLMSPRRKRRWSAIAATTVLFVIAFSTAAVASVWTDQEDYAPGSVVTISGDNSNGAGYLPGETVVVNVSGPNGYESSCEALADDAGAWSCQVTLWESDLAVGEYMYTATGQTSGVSEGGMFTDAQIKIFPAPSGVSFTLTWSGYTNSTCTTGEGSQGLGTISNAGGGHVILLSGAGSVLSGKTFVKFTASMNATDPSGATFANWSSSGDNVITTTTNVSICVRVPSGGQNDAYTATYDVPATNAAPVVAADEATVTVNEGQTASNTGTWSDANAGDTVRLSASIGTVTKAGINAGGTWSWSFGTTDGPDETQVVTISAFDGTATTSTVFSLVVNNVAPTVSNLTGDTPVNENATTEHTYTYDISDPGDDTIDAVTTSCGTGGSKVSGSDSFNDTSGSFKCVFGDGPATPQVSASATDSDNNTGAAATFDVTVNNVAPTITALTPSATNVLVGEPVTFTGTATDPSDVDTTAGFQWSFNGGPYGAAGANTFTTSFSTCGTHTIYATAKDKDDGVSDSFTSGSVGVYDAYFRPPLTEGVYNLVQKGQVVPVKISVGCDGTFLPGLTPKIVLVSGDVDPSTDPSDPSALVTTSVSAADTTGVMREVDGQYIYNLRVPDAAKDAKFTIIVRPFGAGTAGIAAVIKIRK